jgi:hypothetical protein
VVAPFLGSIGERKARAVAPGAPRRLVAMFTHYGCVTTRFFPAKSHGELTADDLAPTTLRHLSPYVGKLLMPRGIRGMNEWTSGLLRGQGNDPHTQVVGSYFTCHPVTPNSDEPFSFAEETKFLAKPIAPSLDHVMARQLSPNGTPLFVRVSGRNDSAQTAISYSAAETIHQGFASPSEVFSALTGLFQDGEPMSPDTFAVASGKSVIDVVRTDLETLERYDMSQSDRMKLAAWKELLHDTGGVVATAQCNSEIAAALGATQPNFDRLAGATGDVLATKLDGTELDGADVYSNVAALAAVCNANPVIVLKYPPHYVFSALGLTIDSHTLSHRIANAAMVGCLPGAIEMLVTIDDFYARKFAHLVGLLDSIDEGEGKVLDNCAAVWFNEMSDGNAHNLNNLPIVQVGSAGGYFKTGCAVNVEDGDPALTAGASENACNQQQIGMSLATGTPPELANAPINKYYCNLMNALGVKAGADGFPAVGGAGDVTHYGMYDETEDFVGGGTNPARITNPGEYLELKANA